MDRHLFDELARGAAAPMPRRRMVRVLGATLAASVLPAALRPGRARAADCSSGYPQSCFQLCCSADDLCCPTDDGVGACCPAGKRTTRLPGGLVGKTICVTAPGGNPCHAVWTCASGTPCGGEPDSPATCCKPDEKCVGGLCMPACSHGRERCGSRCCPKGYECDGGRCRRRCRGEQTRCGRRCCPKGQRCVGGRCRRCPSRHEACGKKCCPKGHTCCTPISKGDTGSVCCDTRHQECGGIGREGRQRITCCPRGTKIAKTILPGDAGIVYPATTVCCPPERIVPFGSAVGCCTPGYVSMGGKLSVFTGTCCRPDRLCGSGDSLNCCPDDYTCQNGVCTKAL
jgi:hypothetical protein